MKQNTKDAATLVCFWLWALLIPVTIPSLAISAPITAEYIKSMGQHLPPDPGLAGQKTLIGEDTNHNGVRDDVERWIFASFPDNPVVRAAALQLAGAMQTVMSVKSVANSASIISLKQQITTALECLLATVDDDPQKTIFRDLQAVIVNTPDRTALIEQIEAAYPAEGVEFDDPEPTACVVAPENLRN